MPCLICLGDRTDFQCSNGFNRDGQSTHEFHRECIAVYLKNYPPVCFYPGCNTNWSRLTPLSERVHKFAKGTVESMLEATVLKMMSFSALIGLSAGLLMNYLRENPNGIFGPATGMIFRLFGK